MQPDPNRELRVRQRNERRLVWIVVVVALFLAACLGVGIWFMLLVSDMIDGSIEYQKEKAAQKVQHERQRE